MVLALTMVQSAASAASPFDWRRQSRGAGRAEEEPGRSRRPLAALEGCGRNGAGAGPGMMDRAGRGGA